MSRIAQKPAQAPGTTPLVRGDIVPLTLTKTVSTVLDRALGAARDALIARQSAQGYWLFELEADCTIPAEYIMMMHFLDEIDVRLESKICRVFARSSSRARRVAAVPRRRLQYELHRSRPTTR